MKKSRFKMIFILIIIISILYFGMIFINSYFGWYGYAPWKYRLGTYGNRNESVERKVFIRDLEYKTDFDIQNFNIYIERGYKFGFHSSKDTRIVSDSKYPYQVSLDRVDPIRKIGYKVVNFNEFDSIDNENICVYLEKPYLKDTLILKILKFDGSNDSIGYLKVWDKTNKE